MKAGTENDAGAIRQTGERFEVMRNGTKVDCGRERKPEPKIGTEDSTEVFDAESSDGNGDVELVRNLGVIGAVSETEETNTETDAGGEVKREEFGGVTAFEERF